VLACGTVAAGGMALAQPADERVFACVSNKGAVRIVAADVVCKDSETARSWSVQGPEGPEGARGPEGPQGPPGEGGGGSAGQPVVGKLLIALPNGSATVDVLAWSHGVSNSGTTSTGGGAAAGKASVQDLNLTKLFDATSVPLAAAVTSGQQVSKATLTLCENAQNCQETRSLVMEMDNVLVTSHSTGGSAGPLVENVSLNFQKITWTRFAGGVQQETATYDAASSTTS
jgi:type VI secretion system secreted protein Hcp